MPVSKKYEVFENGVLVDKDDDPIIRDGQMIRVNMMMMDSRAIDPAAYKTFYDNLQGKTLKTDYEVIADAHAAKTGVQSRSGTFSADQQAARDARQAAYDAKLQGAWKADNAAVASELTPQMKAAAEAQAEKDAAERAASPNVGYDRRISNAWKDTGPDVRAAHAVDPAVKKVAPVNDGQAALDAARSRYHQRLEAGYKQETAE